MPQLDPRQSSKRSLTSSDRDAALARVGRTRRWLLGAAAALTAGLAALASALVPGRSLASKHQTAATGTTGPANSPTRKTEPALPPPASSGQLGLQAPSQAPQPAAPQPDPSQQSAPAAPAQPQPQPSDPSQSSGSSSGSGAATSGGS
ncbi:MAG TPA: hypothetical protein VGY32_01860 [Solirubrobacteraceae bacterium]|nr:hypothetical protein [Solirubrobacteraceae bacterium]